MFVLELITDELAVFTDHIVECFSRKYILKYIGILLYTEIPLENNIIHKTRHSINGKKEYTRNE